MKIGSTDASIAARVDYKAAEAVQGKEPGEKENTIMPQIEDREENQHVMSEKTVINTIEHANKAIDVTYRRFEFSIHEKTKEIMVKVIDTETEEVIREIPPEKILDMVAMMWEMVGIIVDERR